MTEPVILTLPQLQDALAYWQRALRLQDWDITLAITRRKDWKGSASGTAISDWHIPTGHANMHLLNADDYAADSFVEPQDMEVDLVHEMLHGHFHETVISVEEQGIRRDLFEAAIETTARALVRLKRGLAACEARQAGEVQHHAFQYVIGSQPAGGAGHVGGEIKVS